MLSTYEHDFGGTPHEKPKSENKKIAQQKMKKKQEDHQTNIFR